MELISHLNLEYKFQIHSLFAIIFRKKYNRKINTTYCCSVFRHLYTKTWLMGFQTQVIRFLNISSPKEWFMYQICPPIFFPIQTYLVKFWPTNILLPAEKLHAKKTRDHKHTCVKHLIWSFTDPIHNRKTDGSRHSPRSETIQSHESGPLIQNI